MTVVCEDAGTVRFAYPVEMARYDWGAGVSFPDVPGAYCRGETEEEALAQAPEALWVALTWYVDEDEPLPMPSAPEGRPMVTVPVLQAAKLALHVALSGSVGRRVFEARNGMPAGGSMALLDAMRETPLAELEAAIAQLGYRVELVLRPATRP